MKPWILCACFLLRLALGQQPAKIAFEVASIKPSKPMSMGQVRVGMNVDAGMLRYSNTNLRDCIRTAYRVKEFQVEGPDWLGSTRFDIVAKLPDGASKDQVPEMLQSLLAERFKLALHRDTKEHAIYALVPAKGGPKLKAAEVAAGGNAAPGGLPRGGIAVRMDPAGMHLKASSMTLPNLAETISRFCERPVVDATGIDGQYDVRPGLLAGNGAQHARRRTQDAARRRRRPARGAVRAGGDDLRSGPALRFEARAAQGPHGDADRGSHRESTHRELTIHVE